MTNKKYITGFMAAALGLGIMAASPAAQAAPIYQPLAYIDGATNEYSFRMKEEDRMMKTCARSASSFSVTPIRRSMTAR